MIDNRFIELFIRKRTMKRLFLILLCVVIGIRTVTVQSYHYLKKDQSYQREAECYQKKADFIGCLLLIRARKLCSK